MFSLGSPVAASTKIATCTRSCFLPSIQVSDKAFALPWVLFVQFLQKAGLALQLRQIARCLLTLPLPAMLDAGLIFRPHETSTNEPPDFRRRTASNVNPG
jgi:hypothetical protein